MWPILISVGVGLLIAIVYLTHYWWHEEGNKRTARKRMERGKAKEIEAADLLRKWGYKIVSQQEEYSHEFIVGGMLTTALIKVDYIVRRRRKTYVVEVKTGDKATGMNHAPTRRQILEYSLIVPCDGVFLLDMEAEIMSQIIFPEIEKENHFRKDVIVFVIALIIGVIVGMLLEHLGLGELGELVN